ncbi:kinase-like domain-containing protein [Aspergillus unguis]
MKRTRPPSLSRWPRTFSSISRVFCHPRSLPSIPYNKRGLASSRSLSEARCFPSSGWEDVDTSVPVEEETTPNYKPENFYPARIGEVFKNRYQVVGKLGYGSSATVWLCRDLKDHRFVTLKVYIASETVSREIEIYGHLKTIQSGHAGLSCLRPVLEIFQTPSPNQESSHTCLVHPPLGISLDQLTPLLPGGVMTSAMIRTTIRNILAALDFLHTEAHVIHTDLHHQDETLDTS